MPVGGCCCAEGLAGLIDRYAPKYMVGNVLAGDTAPTLELAGFHYFKDPGDGTGIAAAIAAMTAGGIAADLCIRAGTYTRAAGLARFVIPTGCRVWSPGGANIVTNNAENCIWQLTAGATLEGIQLTHSGVLGAAGVALIEAPAGSATVRTHIREVTATINVNIRGAQLTGGAFEVNSCEWNFTGAGAAPAAVVIQGTGGGAPVPGSADIHDSRFNLFNVPIRIGFTGTVQDTVIHGNRITVAAGVPPITAGVNATNCVAYGNVSRGGGGTLPTDVGVGNIIAPGVANIWGA